jgi:hypothetical protein
MLHACGAYISIDVASDHDSFTSALAHCGARSAGRKDAAAPSPGSGAAPLPTPKLSICQGRDCRRLPVIFRASNGAAG